MQKSKRKTNPKVVIRKAFDSRNKVIADMHAVYTTEGVYPENFYSVVIFRYTDLKNRLYGH